MPIDPPAMHNMANTTAICISKDLLPGILLAKNDHNRLILISIPDYSFTPFGQFYSKTDFISNEIINYNDFASTLCEQENVYFEKITVLQS